MSPTGAASTRAAACSTRTVARRARKGNIVRLELEAHSRRYRRLQDATDVFSAFHSPAAWSTLKALQVGTCSSESAPLLEDFRRLRSDMQAAGLFDSSKAYYVMKARPQQPALQATASDTVSSVAVKLRALRPLARRSLLLPVLGCRRLRRFAYGPLASSPSGQPQFLMPAAQALFWQQCGWLAHDFLHHQVFKRRALNDAAGLLFGNICQA